MWYKYPLAFGWRSILNEIVPSLTSTQTQGFLAWQTFMFDLQDIGRVAGAAVVKVEVGLFIKFKL